MIVTQDQPQDSIKINQILYVLEPPVLILPSINALCPKRLKIYYMFITREPGASIPSTYKD